jgi:hypothetical protein
VLTENGELWRIGSHRGFGTNVWRETGGALLPVRLHPR